MQKSRKWYRKHASTLLNATELRKLREVKNSKVFTEIDPSYTVIVESTSEHLFHCIKRENVEFVMMPGRVVKKNSATDNRARKSVVNEFTSNCHSISLGARNKCYLHLALHLEEYQLEASMYEVPVKINKKDTSVYTNILQVQKFNFTGNDYSILMDLASKNDDSAKYTAGDMLKILKMTSTKEVTILFGKTIHRGFDSFIKDLFPEILAIYGSRISYLLLVLKNCDRLSLFVNQRSTAERVAHITRDCHKAAQLAEATGKEVSVLSDDTGDVKF